MTTSVDIQERTDTMDARIEQITPARAEALLANNPVNRHLSEGRVSVYAQAMKRGEWRLNGEAIKLNGDGRLLDGQHRLAAIVESGVTIRSLVVEGLTSDVQQTMDSGAKRLLGDVLAIAGESNSSQLAAAIRIVHAYEVTTIPIPHVVLPKLRPTIPMGVEFLARHPRLRDIPGRSVPGMSASVVQAFTYIFTYVDEDDGLAFFDLMRSGAARPDTAVHALRERMIRHLATRQPLSAMQAAAITFKAFNFWRDGTTVTKLTTWKGGGARPEKFPTLDDTSFPFRLADGEVA